MSQYPPNPNNNPYGQNPPDPNPNQGTAYGSPPSGPGQNPYNPYPSNPGTPGTNPNPYGPYSPNPTQPSTGPGSNPDYGAYNPYAPNPPTPGPATNPNYNPYDPYGQTVASSGTSPNYNPYQTPSPPAPPPGTFPSAPSVPPKQSRTWLSSRVIIFSALALLLIIGGIAFGLISYNTTQQNNANATATAQANSRATATAQANAAASATAQAALTATAIATTYPFSANQVLNDPLSDNSKNNGWQTSQYCKFQGSAYHVVDPQTNTFSSCSAVSTDFTNFTFEVEASLTNGDGIGITFRGKADTSQYYRVAIYTDGTYGIYVYVDTTGTNARTLKSGSLAQTPTLSNTNVIAIVARGTTMTLYFNQTEVVSFTDSTYSHGQIGLASTDLTHATDAVFTNAKVWGLP